jgi:MFS transporter, Spinster family, sphingosine-1-phosphate transporter
MRTGPHALLGLALFTGLNLVNYLDRYVLASVVPPIKAEFGLSDAEVGWLSSAFMIGYFATAPIFGYLGDRWPRKGLIAFGVVFWSAGTILSGLCRDYWTLMLCRVLVGLGEASYATLAPAWLADLFPAARRNNALTIFYVATPVGSALGYLLGSLALSHGGWRTGFFWAGAPGVILALALIALSEPARGKADGGAPVSAAAASAAASPGFGDFLRLFRIPDYTLALAGLTAYTFALGAFAAWGPTFLTRAHGLDLAAADQFFGATLVVAGLFGTLIGGFAATAWRRKSPAGYALMLAVSAALTVVAAAAAFLSHDASVSMAWLAAAMFLAFLSTGPTNTILIEAVPVSLRATAMAASIFVIHLFGDFWSPAVVGLVADLADKPEAPGAGLQTAMLILPAVFSLSVLFWFWLALRQRRQ